jgi:hypothetical protein
MIAFFYLFIKSKRKAEYPSLSITLIGIIFIAIMALDGITSYLHLRETSNSIRFLTGLMAGAALSLFLVPPLNFILYKDSKPQNIIKTALECISFFSLPFLTYFFFYFFWSWIYLFIDYVIAFSILFIFLSINYILASMMFYRLVEIISGEKIIIKHLSSLIIAFLLAVTQFTGLYYLHKAIL